MYRSSVKVNVKEIYKRAQCQQMPNLMQKTVVM